MLWFVIFLNFYGNNVFWKLNKKNDEINNGF